MNKNLISTSRTFCRPATRHNAYYSLCLSSHSLLYVAVYEAVLCAAYLMQANSMPCQQTQVSKGHEVVRSTAFQTLWNAVDTQDVRPQYLWTLNKSKPPGLARHNRDGTFDVANVLICVMLQQILDQGCLADARRAMNHNDIWWRLFRSCVHNRHCTIRQTLTPSNHTLSSSNGCT